MKLSGSSQSGPKKKCKGRPCKRSQNRLSITRNPRILKLCESKSLQRRLALALAWQITSHFSQENTHLCSSAPLLLFILFVLFVCFYFYHFLRKKERNKTAWKTFGHLGQQRRRHRTWQASNPHARDQTFAAAGTAPSGKAKMRFSPLVSSRGKQKPHSKPTRSVP